ncbi:12664_t:CDS:2, partial [Entrophospora sp. SA101]
YLLGSYDELHFVAYFIACLDKLAETPNINAINWYHLQIAREGNYTSQESAQKFWQDIISHMEELKNVFKNVDPTAVLQNSYHGDIKTYPRILGPKMNARNQGKAIGKNNAFNNMRQALIRFDNYANDTEIVTHKHQQSSNGKMDKKKMWSLDDFELGALLGSGRYGKVYKANEKLSGKTVAIKLLYKKEIRDAKMEDQLRREVEIQVSLSLKKYGKFPERKAARYVSQISDALIYLQKNHIIHRDMKPENILLAADGRIKISDFGWAVQHTNPDVRRQTFCGTLDYMAPEMIRTKEGYDLKVDSWALGVLCYEFLIGAPPFADSPNTYETFERIVRVDFQFPDELSPEAKDLISSLLCRDPKQRIPLEDVSKHPWIVKNLKYLKSLS